MVGKKVRVTAENGKVYMCVEGTLERAGSWYRVRPDERLQYFYDNAEFGARFQSSAILGIDDTTKLPTIKLAAIKEVAKGPEPTIIPNNTYPSKFLTELVLRRCKQLEEMGDEMTQERMVHIAIANLHYWYLSHGILLHPHDEEGLSPF